MSDETDPHDLYAINEAAIALYNYENDTKIVTFESVPLSVVLGYRKAATVVVRAYSIGTVVGALRDRPPTDLEGV